MEESEIYYKDIAKTKAVSSFDALIAIAKKYKDIKLQMQVLYYYCIHQVGYNFVTQDNEILTENGLLKLGRCGSIADFAEKYFTKLNIPSTKIHLASKNEPIKAHVANVVNAGKSCFIADYTRAVTKKCMDSIYNESVFEYLSKESNKDFYIYNLESFSMPLNINLENCDNFELSKLKPRTLPIESKTTQNDDVFVKKLFQIHRK